MKRILSAIWELTESVVFALAIFLVTYSFLFQPTEVHGTSSYPTIKPGDRVVTNKIAYLFGSPQRGDFVIVKSPYSADIDFVKRIVGLPNETIKLENGKVYINGALLNEDYLGPAVISQGEAFLSEGQEFQIPQDSYFVMGDNRQNSSDSREFGPIKSSDIVGRVDLRYWPPSEIGLLVQP